MLPEIDNSPAKETFLAIKELMSSIRDLNRRINELKLVIRNPLCSQQLSKDLKNRICDLQNVKHCFIYSIYDLRICILDCASYEDRSRMESLFKIETLYKELKEL